MGTYTHTHTHTHTQAYRHSRTEAILRNQAHAGRRAGAPGLISKNCEFEKEVGIAIKSKETSIASHAVQPVGNTELYAPA